MNNQMDSALTKQQVAISRQAVRDKDDKEQQQPPNEQRNSSLRRLACDACRARKVRCDRRDPPCGRCAKVGTKCRYSSRSKPSASKLDLSQFLSTLDNRLKQAEALLASDNLARNPHTHPYPVKWEPAELSPGMPSTPPAPSEGTPYVATSPMQLVPPYPLANSLHSNFDQQDMPLDKASVQQTALEWPNLVGNNSMVPSDFIYDDSFASMLSAGSPLDQSVPCINPSFDFDFNFFDNQYPLQPSLPPTVPVCLDQKLYDRYFEVFHPIMPIINKTRFQAEMSQPSPSIEVCALSYAMRALSAISIFENGPDPGRLYEKARYNLDICERQESGQSLVNINVLQACSLLTLYELKRPNYTRAWIMLARANALARILGLDKLDGPSRMCTTNWGLRNQSPLPLTPADMEERRRTFWLLYIFDAFASLTTKAGSAFDHPILVALPRAREYPDNSDESDAMPLVTEVFEVRETPQLSSFAGTAIMISLFQDCFQQTQASSPERSYEFWERHYRIEKAMNKCRTTLMGQHVSGSSQGHPMSLTLRMNLDAVAIMLHEAVLTKVQKEDLPPGLADESKSKCSAAAADIVIAIQMARGLADKKLNSFRQLERFFLWPATAAIQVYIRMLYNGQQDAATLVTSLRILRALIKDHVDPEHVDQGLIETVDARVAELEGRLISLQL